MGYVEETGAAQHWRDARITTIYEGTTGIQANDLIGRKIVRDQGRTIRAVLEEMRAFAGQLEGPNTSLLSIKTGLAQGIDSLADATEYILSNFQVDPRKVMFGAVPFLKLFGIVAGGWQLARGAKISVARLTEGKGDPAFYKAKIATARFYAEHVLPAASGLAYTVIHGGEVEALLSDDQV
jgi:acyl-CoA dehydrogenase